MGGSSGGKGDSQTSTMTLPKFVEDYAKANMAKADKASQIGYVPYQGPTVGALNEQQILAMEQNEAAMRAFGMDPGAGVRASIPTPNTYAGGIQGYDPMALYLQSLAKMDPAQRAAIESFSNPAGVAAGNKPAGGYTAGGKGGIPNPMIGGGLDITSLGYKPSSGGK